MSLLALKDITGKTSDQLQSKHLLNSKSLEPSQTPSINH